MSFAKFNLIFIGVVVWVLALVGTGASHVPGIVILRYISPPSNSVVNADSSVASYQPQQAGEKKATISPASRERIRQAIASVGIIWVRDSADSTRNPWRRASGVIVRKDGIVATNYHVIAIDKTNRLYDEVFFSLPDKGTGDASLSNRYRLKVEVISKSDDLALFRIVSDSEGKPIADSVAFSAVEIGDARSVAELDDLFIIGFPDKGGSTVTVNAGLVEGKDILANWIKTDARLIQGNSGGAAVNGEGKLIGIPTKVVSDEKRIDSDGDGFPDEVRNLGEVGFLRPSHLVGLMLAQVSGAQRASAQEGAQTKPSLPGEAKGKNSAATRSELQFVQSGPLVVVRGIIRSATTGSPITGARVGLVVIGSEDVTPQNLLTWGSTNAEGKFQMNNPVPPGRYKLRAKTLRYETVTRDVEVVQAGPEIVIEMRLSRQNQQ